MAVRWVVPKQLNNLFIKITNSFPKLLGNNLVGIYLYGSLTYGTFNEKTSDIDCIVVLNRNLNGSKFKGLNKWYKENGKINPWVKRLEMSYLIKKDLLSKNSKTVIYHDGLFKRGLPDGNSIIWLNILKNGIILYGPKPKSFVPEISKKILYTSLKLELKYLKEGINRRKQKLGQVELLYQVYAVLTACRILYTFKNGTILSKESAAKWCIKKLPKNYRKIIKIALKNIHNPSVKPNPVLEKFMPGFINVIDRKIKIF